MQAASLPRPAYNAFARQLQHPCGLWLHAGRGKLLPTKVVHADQRAADPEPWPDTVSPSPTEAKAPALAVVAHPRAGAGRGEGTFAAGPWGAVSLLREAGEPYARCIVRRVVWRDGVPESEHDRHANGELATYADFAVARAVADALNGEPPPAPVPVKRRRKPRPSDQLPLFARQRCAERAMLLGAP